MNEHPFPNSDKLYILPCIQEKQATGGMDKENIPGRPSACFQDAVDVSKKMNNSLAKICVGDNMNNNTLCTYDGAPEYIGNKRTSCSSELFGIILLTLLIEEISINLLNLQKTFSLLVIIIP